MAQCVATEANESKRRRRPDVESQKVEDESLAKARASTMKCTEEAQTYETEPRAAAE